MGNENRAKRQEKNKCFWNFTAAANGNDPPELILYGDISSESWWGDEITPRKFSEDLAALGNVQEITVRINSGGGDVFAANAIYTRLKDHPAKINVKIDGWAASAATIIAMAGDVVEIPANGIFMVHDPQMGVCGHFSAEEFRKIAAELEIIKQSIVNGYALKTGMPGDEIAALMETETWYDGQQAVDAGFCDKVMFADIETTVENTGKVIINSVPLDLGRFPNMPVSMLNRLTENPSGGFSYTQIPKNTEKERMQVEGNNEIKTIEDLQAMFPGLAKQIAENAANEERKRIQDIENIALAGYEEIVNEAKFMKPVSAGDVAKMILAEQKKQGAAYLAGRDSDAQDSNAGQVGAGSVQGMHDSGTSEIDAVIDRVLPKAKGGIGNV